MDTYIQYMPHETKCQLATCDSTQKTQFITNFSPNIYDYALDRVLKWQPLNQAGLKFQPYRGNRQTLGVKQGAL